MKNWNEEKEDKEAGLGVLNNDEEEKAQQKKIDAEARRIYNEKAKVIDMTRRRVTDLDCNNKVYLPKAMDALHEAKFEVRNDQFRKIHSEYKKKNCKEDDS